MNTKVFNKTNFLNFFLILITDEKSVYLLVDHAIGYIQIDKLKHLRIIFQ
jgi:hypothetical protein